MEKALITEMAQALAEAKRSLEAELLSVGKRDEHATEDDYGTRFPDFGDKEDENAAEVASFSDNLSLGYTLEAKLRDVEHALERIANGTYGRCRYCNKEIDQRRLRARPESNSCVSCKTEQLQRT